MKYLTEKTALLLAKISLCNRKILFYNSLYNKSEPVGFIVGRLYFAQNCPIFVFYV